MTEPLREAIARIEEPHEAIRAAYVAYVDAQREANARRLYPRPSFEAGYVAALASQSQHIGELEGALEPFAKVAEAAQHTHMRDGQCVWRVNYKGELLELTRQDFRRAGTALSGKGGGDD